MKKYIYSILLLGSLAISFSACNKYLDIKPEDKFLSSQIFDSEINAQTALNGIYLRMSDDNSYGGNLMLTYVELLGQQYDVNSTVNTVHQYSPLGSYVYGSTQALDFAERTWTFSYSSILNANRFIERLGNSKDITTQANFDLMMGQAYVLRAMHYLDLLRLFGPVYSTDSISLSIPYYSRVTKEATPILPANQVMDSIIRDLDVAKQYLQNDPIRNAGPTDIANNRGVEVEGLYQLRANYFTAAALKARALLYRGDKVNAYLESSTLIDECSTYLKFTSASDLFTATPDRIFSSEIIFGLYNHDISKKFDLYFSPSLVDERFLTMKGELLVNVFEGLSTDCRLNPNWILPTTGKTVEAFYKYEELVTSIPLVRKYVQPLIRLSEIYLIAAETAEDPLVGMTYENAVRNARGVHGIEDPALLETSILNEYRREFIGEGQLFFTYKRMNKSSIQSGQSGGTTISMHPAQYVVPLPKSETDSRN